MPTSGPQFTLASYGFHMQDSGSFATSMTGVCALCSWSARIDLCPLKSERLDAKQRELPKLKVSVMRRTIATQGKTRGQSKNIRELTRHG
jgi:hypothetical protein